jgi:hypothetical protein
MSKSVVSLQPASFLFSLLSPLPQRSADLQAAIILVLISSTSKHVRGSSADAVGGRAHSSLSLSVSV